MKNKTAILTTTIALITGLTIGYLLFNTPPPYKQPDNTILIHEGLTPINIYPTPFKNWTITISYGGHGNSTHQWDWYQATKNDQIVEAPTLYELAKKIRGLGSQTP